MSYGLPPFIQDAAVAALRMDPDPSQEVRANLDRKRAIVEWGLSNLPGVRLHQAVGGMFVLLDVSALHLGSHDFATGLLDAHDVSVLPCDGFGPSGSGLIRISACASDEHLETACERMSVFIRHLADA